MIEEAWALRPALEQAQAIARREIRPKELVELYYQRIDRIDPELCAYVLLTPELAEAQAAAAEAALSASRPQGLLHGVPVSIKELTPLAGHRHTMGSVAFRDTVAQVDGFAVAQLKKAGTVILGKTNAPEFGTRPVTEGPLYRPARNPWDRERTAGGSSGGAAAAVAAGLCALAHGTDGGGSVRIPASCCGVVGLKPSRGRISSGPLLGEGWAGLSTAGVLARTVGDAAAGLDAMAGHLPGDPYWAEVNQPFLPAAQREPKHQRVGFMVSAPAGVDPEVAQAVKRTAAGLERMGHRVDEVYLDLSGFRDAIQLFAITAVAALPIQDLSVLDALNRRKFEVAASVSGVQYLQTLNAMHAASRRLIAAWETMDVLLTPTLTFPAPRLGELGADPERASEEFLDWLSFTHPFNCTGQPAISLPLASSSQGLPIGIQLVTAPRDEYTLLSLAAQLENAFRPVAAAAWPA